MGKTPIEWADHSINPFRARNIETGAVGHFCVKCSPGCKHCYSSKMQKPYLTQLEFIAENRPKVELFFEEKAIREVLRRRKPTDYFWCDMTDMFLDEYPDEWIDRCFAAMALTPQHTHMVLTKRSERLRSYCGSESQPSGINSAIRQMMRDGKIPRAHDDQSFPWAPWPLPNVRLGVSIEDRQRKSRIEDLRNAPATVRFLSVEPLLEDIGTLDLTGIHWAIVGGESGSEARPFDIEWARGTVAQCKAAGVACFVKQLGAKPFDSLMIDILGPDGKVHYRRPVGHPMIAEVGPANGYTTRPSRLNLRDKKGGAINEWPDDLRVREMPEVRS